jgi:NhaP-type Na+/H+ or K+/H+ antiporter
MTSTIKIAEAVGFFCEKMEDFMLISLALIFLLGLLMGAICQKLKLPKIIGILFTGIFLGPFALNLLDPSILSISQELRKIALIIILLKAGLTLDLSDLKKVGRPAVLLSFLPASFEIGAYLIFGPKIFSISRIDAAIMGAVLAAVSPAVVVPRMVDLIKRNYGKEKAVPQMIMAGASCDDIFVIVLFTSFLNMAQGGKFSITNLLNVPLSIIFGVLLGAFVGYLLYIFFEKAYQKDNHVRNSTKLIIILGVSFILVSIEDLLAGKIPLSGLLAVVSMACLLKFKTISFVSDRLSEKFGKLWIAAELMLFVLVGAAVDIRYTMEAGFSAVLMIFIGLIFRSIGVLISTYKTKLNSRERLFTVFSYLPKATVQAAIGSIPLSLGLSCGKIVLSVAVLSIIITAPLGALAMDKTYEKFLEKN